MLWGVGWGRGSVVRNSEDGRQRPPPIRIIGGERDPRFGGVGGELGVERPPQGPLPSAEGYLPALPLQPGRLRRPRPGTPVLQALHPLILALGLAQGGYPAHFPPLPSRGSVLPRPRASCPDMESNLSGLVPAAGLVPALPPAVTLGLTAAYTTLYALLFFSVYAQLWLVLLYGHKRLSYQTVFLALCLLWAALRTTLFSFYFRDTPRANRLGPLPFWLLYCCPVCLQFFTLTLMNLYFAQVVFKAKAKRRPEMSRGLLAVRGAFVGASLLFLLVNVLCAVLSRRRRAQPWALLLVRVLVSDSLFVICALSLAACLCLVARRAPSTSIYLEAKGTSVCQAAAMGGAMVLLYASRACYNLAALALAPRSRLDAFDYDWYNVSDQADLVNDLGNKGYLVFGLILFVWELLPTTLLVGFFRVHRPPQDLSTSRILNGQVFGSRSYFFDRAGHCEDEGCSWEHGHSESTSMSGSLGSGSWYGAIGREPGWCGGSQTRTTPLLFSQVLGPGGHHHSLYSTPQT
ncbi:integral membrane protein GPR137 [Mustela putorius furo]|uniref:Integral membrane protein GPR137 n=3 Tax=Caniformia TaxID=379584 RepID=A0A8U0N880_MUSPF|nr:integral membrane protein GPR137 [Mustela putorius furo]